MSRDVRPLCFGLSTGSGLSTQKSPSSHLCLSEDFAREGDGRREMRVAFNLQDNLVDNVVDGVEARDQGGDDRRE